MKMERIKTFLSIKQRPEIKKKLLEIENLFEDINFRFLKINNHVGEVERAKETALKVNHDLNTQILKRVDMVAQQTNGIRIERIHTKEELFDDITNEMKGIQEAHAARVNDLEEQLKITRNQSKVHYKDYLNLKTEMEREKVMCSQGTQLQLENIIDFTSFDEIENWNSSLNNFIIEGRDLGVEWGNVIISDIISSKLVSEWESHQKRKPLRTLKEFILEYFITNFPTRNLSLQLLKDFLITLKSHFLTNLKYECFLRMAGFHEIMHRPRIDLETYIKRNKIQLEIWTSPKVFHLFAHFCLEVKSHKKCTSDYFLPNHDDNSSYLIPATVASSLLESTLKAFNLSPNLIKDLSGEIPDRAEKDMFRRMLNKQTVHEKEGSKHKFICWDALASFVLDSYVQTRLVMIESLATDMRLFCKDRYESRSTYENFCFSLEKSDHFSQFSKDKEWLRQAYSKFIHDSENKNTKIEHQVANIVSMLESYTPISKDKFYIPLKFLINKCRFLTADERFGAQKILTYLKNRGKIKGGAIKPILNKKGKKKKQITQDSLSKSRINTDESKQSLVVTPGQSKHINVLSKFLTKLSLQNADSISEIAPSPKKQPIVKMVNETLAGYLGSLPIPKLIDYYFKNYVNDILSEILVKKQTFAILEDIFEQKAKNDNSLVHELREFRKFLSRQPISLIHLSHDDYDKIEKEELIRVQTKLNKQFTNLCTKMFVEY